MLVKGDPLCFFKDEEHRLIMIINAKDVKGSIPGFDFKMGFSVSKELMEMLLAKKSE